jgi:hypothetical protein
MTKTWLELINTFWLTVRELEFGSTDWVPLLFDVTRLQRMKDKEFWCSRFSLRDSIHMSSFVQLKFTQMLDGTEVHFHTN